MKHEATNFIEKKKINDIFTSVTFGAMIWGVISVFAAVVTGWSILPLIGTLFGFMSGYIYSSLVKNQAIRYFGLTKNKSAYYKENPDEKLLFVWRRSILTLIFKTATTILISAVIFTFVYLLFQLYLHYTSIFLTCTTLLVFATISIIFKEIIDWYLHFFILTNKKILEVRYSPLYASFINDVLLDQIRFTEIQVARKGILGEFLDLGDIKISFDRPTHSEEFVITGIRNPEESTKHLMKILQETLYTAFKKKSTAEFLQESQEELGHEERWQLKINSN